MRIQSAEKNDSHTHELILIGGDSCEDGLGKNERLVGLAIQVLDRIVAAGIRSSHQVNSRLIFVHRVQYQLQIKIKKISDSAELGIKN